jgi:hypothetical protein
MRIVRCIALAAALTIPAAALCQDPEHVRPGAPLDMTFIRPGLDSVAIMTERGGQSTQIGFAVLETRIDSASGAPVVIQIQRLLIRNQPPVTADSAHLHGRTLLPISAHKRGDTPFDFIFGPTSVRMVSLRNANEMEVPLASPMFYSNSVELLLRALPLRVGYRAVLPVFAEGFTSELHLSVTGEERVRTPDGGACTSLVVEAREGEDTGTYRIETATRDIVRFDSEFATLVRPTGCH